MEIIDEASALSADKSTAFRGGPLESTAYDMRKERDKIRKRKARAARLAGPLSTAASADIPRTASLSDHTAVLDSELKNGIQEEKQGNKKASNQGIRARGTRMEPNAKMGDVDRQFAVKSGLTNIDHHWAEYVDYWVAIPAHKGVKTDWPATWRNRVRKIVEWKGSKNERDNQNRSNRNGGSAPTNADVILAGVARFVERKHGHKFTDRPSDGPVRGFADDPSRPHANGSAADHDRGSYPQLEFVPDPDAPKR